MKTALLTIAFLLVHTLTSFSQTKVIVNGYVLIKDAPSDNGKFLKSFDNRVQLEILGSYGNYYKVKIDDIEGYTSKGLIDNHIIQYIGNSSNSSGYSSKKNYSSSLAPPANFNHILDFVTSFSFNGSNYVPDYYSSPNSYNPYEVFQGRYDAGFKTIQNEYQKLLGLELLNIRNNNWLNSEKSRVKNLVSSRTNLDWSKQENVNHVISIITNYMTKPEIKEEIKLLQKIRRSYINLRSQNSEGFYKTEKWQELVFLMNEMKNCNSCNFSEIGYKYNVY